MTFESSVEDDWVEVFYIQHLLCDSRQQWSTSLQERWKSAQNAAGNFVLLCQICR